MDGKITIQKITLTNFESYGPEPTEIYFEEGLNVLSGKSCAGKSSVLRSVRSVTTPRSFCQSFVREGADFCIIRIDTNVGYIQAEKGAGKNTFEYQIYGENPEPVKLNAPGDVSFEVSNRVIGIDTIKIESAGEKKTNNKRISVNMMVQSSPGGLLDENSKNKAATFDALCGISSSEDIREGIKNGLALRKKKNDEFVTLLTSVRQGSIPEKKLSDAREEYNSMADDYDVILEQKKSLKDILDSHAQHSTAVVKVQQLSTSLADPTLIVPERAVLAEFRDNSPKKVHSLVLMKDLERKHTTVLLEWEAYGQALKRLPTTEASKVDGYKGSVLVLASICKWQQAKAQVEVAQSELGMVGSVGDTGMMTDLVKKFQIAKKWYDTKISTQDLQQQFIITAFSYPQGFEREQAKGLVEKIFEARKMYKAMSELKSAVVSTESELADCCNTLEEYKKKRIELLDKVTVCPVTGKAIGQVCSLWEEKQTKG